MTARQDVDATIRPASVYIRRILMNNASQIKTKNGDSRNFFFSYPRRAFRLLALEVMRIGEKIQRLLDVKGWTKARIAKTAGVHHRNIGYIMAGDREPGVQSAISLARALEVPIEWLFDDTQDWPPPTKPVMFSLEILPDALLIDEVVRRRQAISGGIEKLTQQCEALIGEVEKLPIISDPTFFSMLAGLTETVHRYLDTIDQLFQADTQIMRIREYEFSPTLVAAVTNLKSRTAKQISRFRDAAPELFREVSQAVDKIDQWARDPQGLPSPGDEGMYKLIQRERAARQE